MGLSNTPSVNRTIFFAPMVSVTRSTTFQVGERLCRSITRAFDHLENHCTRTIVRGVASMLKQSQPSFSFQSRSISLCEHRLKTFRLARVTTDLTLTSFTNASLSTMIALIEFFDLEHCHNAFTMPDVIRYRLRTQECVRRWIFVCRTRIVSEVDRISIVPIK
jgi:hypothetical protein